MITITITISSPASIADQGYCVESLAETPNFHNPSLHTEVQVAHTLLKDCRSITARSSCNFYTVLVFKTNVMGQYTERETNYQ